MTPAPSKVKTLLGPPGTGKTTTLLDEIDRLLESGVLPQQIAFVSYTKPAVKNAIERASSRFDIDPEAFEYFQTIHAMALRSFRGDSRPKVMDDADWKAFGESCAYEFSEDASEEPTLNYTEDGDCLRNLHKLSRVKRCSINEAILHAGDVPPHIDAGMVELFAARLEAWKRGNGKIDFEDMLERSLASPWRPPVRFAFIDEAQDSSRIQNALSVLWFWENSRCELVRYAGDDDQAIFGWSGGDDGALVRLASKTECRTLDQSHRVPQLAHAMAKSIIEQNSNRVPKTYRPRDEVGSLLRAESASYAIDMCSGSSFVLVRNIMFAEEHRKVLLASGRMFSCEIGAAAPLDRKDTAAAFRAVSAWRRGGNVTASDLVSLLKLIPSKIDGRVILPRGAKTRAKENEDPVPIWRAREQFGLGLLLEVITRDTGMFDLITAVRAEERRYLELVLARDPELQRPKIVTTTMHRSKGREAECVVISPDMANRSYRRHTSARQEAREEENRVHYVAATRTLKTLIIEEPTDHRHYEYGHHIARTRRVA